MLAHSQAFRFCRTAAMIMVRHSNAARKLMALTLAGPTNHSTTDASKPIRPIHAAAFNAGLGSVPTRPCIQLMRFAEGVDPGGPQASIQETIQ